MNTIRKSIWLKWSIRIGKNGKVAKKQYLVFIEWCRIVTKAVANREVFVFERETEHEWVGGREREAQNLKQVPGSELSAESP